MATSFPFSWLWLLPPEPGRATAKERKARATDVAPGGAEGPAPERRAGAAGGGPASRSSVGTQATLQSPTQHHADACPARPRHVTQGCTRRAHSRRPAHTRAGPRTCSLPHVSLCVVTGSVSRPEVPVQAPGWCQARTRRPAWAGPARVGCEAGTGGDSGSHARCAPPAPSPGPAHWPSGSVLAGTPWL